MIDFEHAAFDYEPYPAALLRPALDPAVYDALAATFPDRALFEHKPNLGNKYSLSELSRADDYRRFIASTPAWKRFHDYVKGDDFIPRTLAFLKARHVDIGLRDYRVVSHKTVQSSSSVWNRIQRRTEVNARFEFSMMGADGGHIVPHTDLPQKLVTLVFSMMKPGEWDPAWGGGTDVVVPKDRSRVYNQVNRYMTFGEVDVLKTWDFTPNQCLLFVKTYNSWHSVSPMTGPPGGSGLRKTLTVNIEVKA